MRAVKFVLDCVGAAVARFGGHVLLAHRPAHRGLDGGGGKPGADRHLAEERAVGEKPVTDHLPACQHVMTGE